METFFSAHQIGFYLVAITTAHLGAFWFLNRKAIQEGIKGEDGKYQLIEIIGYVSVVVWPNIILADAFFGFHASAEAWWSMNIVIGVAVLGISYDKYLKSKEGDSNLTK